MEHPARRRLIAAVLGFFTVAMGAPLAHAARAVSFSLSTNRTFAPGEKPTLHLYTHNVDELEFRVYHVQDPEKFILHLPDMHSFGQESVFPERVDEETWLERFHDWKHHLWFLVRHFFRGQFSDSSRDYFRARQASLARRSRIVGVAEFAQIPLLNDRQLVARWRQELPPTYISDSQDLPIDPLPSGLYLVEATDGHYKAYTLLMVSRIVVVTRTTPGHLLAWAVDRQTGAPIAEANVRFGVGNKVLDRATTSPEGTAAFNRPSTMPAGQIQDDLWTLATKGNDVALVTPSSWSFSSSAGSPWVSYVYTDRPVYRPGHTVHWKAVLRRRVENHLELPRVASMHVRISDEQDHSLFEQDMPASADGTVSGELPIPASASLGYYTIRLGGSDDGIAGSFHVEDYRKPEYQVRVTPQAPRVLQGGSMQVTIDSRYFFGEPVAFGNVRYRVYSSQHFWWDEDSDSDEMDQEGGDQQSDFYGASENSEQSGKLDANGKLTITVPVPVDISKHPSDQDFYVEAAVTDEANREISGRGHFLATYGSYRIHVEPDIYAVQSGGNASFTVSAVDYDNKPVNANVHLQLNWVQWANGMQQILHTAAADVATGPTGTTHATIAVPTAGNVEVGASSATPEGRTVQDQSWLWVIGSGEENWFGGGSHPVQIVADKKSYAPGDVAHLSIISDAQSYHALVIATGYTTEFQKVIDSNGSSASFDLPITADAQPNLDVSVVFLRDGQLYQASKQIKVPPTQERLQVEIARSKDTWRAHRWGSDEGKRLICLSSGNRSGGR